MQSCLYEGWVFHGRRVPVENRFRYRLFLAFLDLGELDEVFGGRWLWSHRHPAPARFRREDHLGDPHTPLDESVRQLVVSAGRPRPSGPIRLLTHVRYFGFAMNPVSFYFCYDVAGKEVEVVVAEVNNTPWGEQHCYIIGPEHFDEDKQKRLKDKEFHVSPFMGMDLQYRWWVGTPDQSLSIRIQTMRQSECQLDVTLQLSRQPITSRTLATSLVRYPFMTHRVFLGIYCQAARLWLKRCPVYPHPKHIKAAGQTRDQGAPLAPRPKAKTHA